MVVRIRGNNPSAIINGKFYHLTRRAAIGSRGERFLKHIERLVAIRNAPGEEQEAFICLGGASQFVEPNRTAPRFNNDDQDDDDEEDEVPTVTFTEIEGTRKVTPLRVENPEDATQYVMVNRIDQIDFSSSEDEIIRRFVLTHPEE